MNDTKLNEQTPKWLLSLAPFLSALLGAGALWYTWTKYHEIVDPPSFEWYGWIRPALITLVGMFFLLSTLLFIAGKAGAGWSLFVGSISAIPLILFVNLIVLLVRVVIGLFQGEASDLFSKLFATPFNKALLVVAIIFAVRTALHQFKKYSR
ncbi:hypothetical protein [Paenibacillus sp. OV219]|uniref:hypothetical protein n=1 Tax=Paenibacillus sp. OV219 TaxID=1884377 RepID=UPI0008D0886D|nr:hypothetical protein [Paenibacillus sp. OV219]SEO61085.1 hypothetical protein SAMN05518847_10921 [Paenibacillus sp. OV219]